SYFVVVFVLYATSDFVAWRLAVVEALKEWAAAQPEGIMTQQQQRKADIYRRHAARFRYVSLFAGPVSFLRALFEFLLPVVVGVYATLLLLKAPPPLQQEHQNAPVIVLPQDTIGINSDVPIHLFP